MWPITVKVLQDSNGWQVFAQILSSLAVIIAAIVAARYANRQYRNKIRGNGKYLLSLLVLLDSYINVMVESVSTDDSVTANNFYNVMIKEAEKIVLLLENKIYSFAVCTNYFTLLEIHYLIFYYREAIKEGLTNDPSRFDSLRGKFAESWSPTVGSLKRAIGYHKCYLHRIPIRNVLLFLFRKKIERENKIEPKNMD